MAAAVVNNLVLEAGVNSLSASWKKSTLPVESDNTSMPQNPRARSVGFKNCTNPFIERLARGGVQLRKQQQAQRYLRKQARTAHRK